MEIIINMNKLNNIILNSNYIDKGKNGEIYRVNDHLYKLYYNRFNLSDNKIDPNYSLLHEDNEIRSNNKNDYDKINYLISINPDVKHSVLPDGTVTINNTLIGITMPYLNEYVNLKQYLDQVDTVYYDQLINNIWSCIDELLCYRIYYNDIKYENIMINPQTNDIKLIDLDDKYTEVLDEFDSSLERHIMRKYDEFQYIFKKQYQKKIK